MRSMVLRTFLSVCLALIVSVFYSGVASPDKNVSNYSVEELVALVTDKLTSIDSLDCEYSVQYGKSDSPRKCRSARSGTKWRFEGLSTGQKGRKSEKIFCYDDNIVYAFSITHQGGKDKWGLVELQDPRDQGNLDPDDLLGVKLSNVSRSIANVLKIAAITKSEKILPDGNTGVGLVVKAVPRAIAGTKKMIYDVVITLDPAHDSLPQEIVITESKENITWPGWEQRWKILEFRQVLDERTNNQRWFPVSGILTQGQGSSKRDRSIRMKVDKVRINPTIPFELFRPQIPDGTTVSDVTKDGRGKIVIKGGHVAIGKRISEVTKQAHSVRSRSPWRQWYILASIVVLVLSMVFLWRRQLRRSKLTRP